MLSFKVRNQNFNRMQIEFLRSGLFDLCPRFEFINQLLGIDLKLFTDLKKRIVLILKKADPKIMKYRSKDIILGNEFFDGAFFDIFGIKHVCKIKVF
jgi:hypothetical protein